MSWMRRILRTFHPQSLDTSLDDELRFHIEQRTEDFIGQGMSPVEARRQAELLFGNRTVLRESTRALPYGCASGFSKRFARLPHLS